MNGQRPTVIGGLSPRDDPVARLHRFQGEHPEVQFTAPHMGGRGRYLAVVPAGSVPGDPREITVNSLDLAGLMDQLEENWPPEESPAAGSRRAPCAPCGPQVPPVPSCAAPGTGRYHADVTSPWSGQRQCHMGAAPSE